jgi:hypothetical protein
MGTVAGSGPDDSTNGGYYGDGGPAVKALMDLPTSVALDGGGNLYFCDWNARIRKVDARTGIITTVAGIGLRGFSGDGGSALTAQLGGPAQLRWMPPATSTSRMSTTIAFGGLRRRQE